MRSFYVIFLGFISFCFSQDNHDDPEKHIKSTVRLSCPKTIFYSYEPIWITCHMVNHNNPPLSREADYGWQVTDQNGTKFRQTFHIDILEYTNMSLGEKYNFKKGLLGTFQHPDSLMNCKNQIITGYWHPGKYQIQIMTNNITSNIIEIEIVAPPNDKEIELLLFLEGIKYLYSEFEQKGIIKLKELISDYPSSVYREQSIILLCVYYSDSNNDKDTYNEKIEFSKMLLDEYPDSAQTRYALFTLRSDFRSRKDHDGLIIYFSGLNKRTKSNRLKKIIRLILDKAENNEY